MIQFSANLGFLWQELQLTDGIRAAADAGFSAVECHWPYDVAASTVREALQETELPMLGINTVRGNVEAGDNGLSALSSRLTEAREAIDQAVEYASLIKARNIHVMAGYASGKNAHDTFMDNLSYAAGRAAGLGITILIEPLNHFDAPGYFLSTSVQAESIINELDLRNVKLMFDCYHVQIMEGDITRRLQRLLPIIGHVQIASVPSRGAPDVGELDYGYVIKTLDRLGYSEPVGAEYKPVGATRDSLQWMSALIR